MGEQWLGITDGRRSGAAMDRRMARMAFCGIGQDMSRILAIPGQPIDGQYVCMHECVLQDQDRDQRGLC